MLGLRSDLKNDSPQLGLWSEGADTPGQECQLPSAYIVQLSGGKLLVEPLEADTAVLRPFLNTGVEAQEGFNRELVMAKLLK